MERAERAGMDVESLGGGRDKEAVMRFVERCALTLTEAGIPRMPARVFVALLVSDDGRRTAAELAEMLKVSPAAVSNAVRYLQQVRLAVREREPGERRDHYRLYNDTWYEAVTHKDEMLEGIEAVGADTPAGRRLEETRRFYAFLLDEMPRLMERWRKVRSESAAEEGV